MEAQIKELKDVRTKLKSKITATSTKLETAIKMNGKSVVDRCYEELDSVYYQFIEIHEQYAELTSDETYESYQTVGGLNLDEYASTVNHCYSASCESYMKFNNELKDLEAASCKSNTELILKKATSLNKELLQAIDSQTISTIKPLLEELESVNDALQEFHLKLKQFNRYSDFLNEVNTFIFDLNMNIMKAKRLLCNETRMQVGHQINHNVPNSSISSSIVNSSLTSTSTTQSTPSILRPSHLGSPGGAVSSTLLPQTSIVHAYTVPVAAPSTSANSSNSSNNPGCNHSKLLKTSYLIFTGARKEWAEFSAVWRKYAESEYTSDIERAWALKQSLRGKPYEYVKAIYITQPGAYDRMWHRLESIYSDVSTSVQSAYEDLKKLKGVKEDDLKGLVKFINDIELCYSQLGEVGQLESITLSHIDDLADLLPVHTRKDWMRIYQSLTVDQKIHPFSSFMLFLESEREIAIRLSERPGKNGSNKSSNNSSDSSKSKVFHSHVDETVSNCVVHTKSGTTHGTADCRNFLKMEISMRLETLKRAKACFRCFGLHPRSSCKSNLTCTKCGKDNHHTLLCKSNNSSTHVSDAAQATDCLASQVCKSVHSILPIQDVKVYNASQVATVFFDGGSNSSYITHASAKAIKARRLSNVVLDIVTMGNLVNKYSTCKYEVKLLSCSNDIVKIEAYGMSEITSGVLQLDDNVLRKLLPQYDPKLFHRSSSVDILIGNDYYGLHPKYEVVKVGEHLSVLSGVFGICLQGAHPKLNSNESSVISNSMIQGLIGCEVNQCFLSSSRSVLQQAALKVDNFIQGEELTTEVQPKCGACKCSKCPLVGHTYSFQEEQELGLIQRNLRYDANLGAWVTKYPWIIDPMSLPDNYSSALATLRSTERTLMKDSSWAALYSEQIIDMLDRNVAKKLSKVELDNWKGPIFYISHLAVHNPKSKSTPIRIVFNSSQTFHGMSLNNSLAKGPDAYVNNLVGLLLRWREDYVVLVADIRKMYNSIYIEENEQHCHRFLWRDLDTSRNPDTYVMLRVNMGDKPASAISTEAIYQTASLFREEFPRVAKLLRESTYVDDIIDSVSSEVEAFNLAKDTEKALGKAGFRIKCWQFSGCNVDCHIEGVTTSNSLLKGDSTHVSILGVNWNPESDCISFVPSLNFSVKRRGHYVGDNLNVNEIPSAIPLVLTRRIVLEQVMKIYDPLGLLSPFTLLAKCYLRETWSLKLSWDEALPSELREKWIEFFKYLFDLSSLNYDRCLKPKLAVGSPELVIFSDGSDIAYGFAAYIRWKLQDGSFWCRLILSKSKIAPVRKLSTPQMELNGAVLSKRGRKVIEKEMRFKFSNVYQVIDSETVLCMLNKLSTRFKLYEGVRVGEIQAATAGDMSCWYWVDSKSNSADFVTRCKFPHEIGLDSEWWLGPKFLYSPVEGWNIKPYVESNVILPGEKKFAVTAISAQSHELVEFSRFSSARKLVWTIARIVSMFEKKSFRGGQVESVTVDHVNKSKLVLVQQAQSGMHSDLAMTKNRYAKLNPVLNSEGVWVVGSRLSRFNPMNKSCEDDLQILLPSCHEYTKLLMRDAHVASGHRGRDATLARFRYLYWTPQGSKVAQSVKFHCQLCRLRDAQLVKQQMGKLPLGRLKPSPPFNTVMLDLFGPYQVRGEVQKRVTGKAYGIIFTDLFSRAVHIEVASCYDTNSFLLALRKFVSIRGWPHTIYSDPGSQLIGAEKELRAMWASVDKKSIYKVSVENGLNWIFGPADSPWHQGAVESLVKAAKRCIKFAFGNKRCTVSELTAGFYEVANILNERPIGITPSVDSAINVLTPNCMLLGRAFAQNPGNWIQHQSTHSRQQLVNDIMQQFWDRWSQCYAPTLVRQNKWVRPTDNLRVGDVVAVADSNCLRADYRIAQITEVFPGQDGKVRKVALRYKSFKVGSKPFDYKGQSITVFRSVRRLALLVPAEP